MALIETFTIGVGAAVAKAARKLWLKDSDIAAAAATSTVDIVAKMLPFSVRGPAQREFDRIAEEVGRNLERFLEAECPNLPENEKAAAALAVATALDRAAISNDVLFAKDLAPVALERHVLEMVPDGDRDLSGDLYARILRESCNYIVEIRSTLPSFGLRAIQESLQREGEIIALVKQVLEAMPRSRGAGAGDESDEAFESQYRQNVARELDQLRLFGITTERVSPRYGLSVAYITLSAARTRSDDEAPSDDEGDASMDSMPVDEALAGSERVLIRGEAGSGKTTLLQWLAVQSTRDAFTGPLAEWVSHCSGCGRSLPTQRRSWTKCGQSHCRYHATGLGAPSASHRRSGVDRWSRRAAGRGAGAGSRMAAGFDRQRQGCPFYRHIAARRRRRRVAS